MVLLATAARPQGGWFPGQLDRLPPNVLPAPNKAVTLDAKAKAANFGREPPPGPPPPPSAAVFAVPIRFMKLALMWPETQNQLMRFWASKVMPMFNVVQLVGGAAYIVEGDYASFVQPLTTIGDMAACGVCLAKLLLLVRAAPQLARMRRSLQFAFTDLETVAEPEASAANARCAARCGTVSMRFMWMYVLLSGSALAMTVVNAFGPAEKRRLTLNYPSAALRCPYTYWPLLTASTFAIGSFMFYAVAYDAFFLSLCMHLSCKLGILNVMLRRAGQHADRRHVAPAGPAARKEYDFEHWMDDGSALEGGTTNGFRRQVEDRLRTCVIYHNMVIKLRDETEDIFAGVSLFQMGYILLGLGIPTLRLMQEKSVQIADAIFLLFYASWVFCQLLFYCWFPDRLAEASLEVSSAAYAALRAAESGSESELVPVTPSRNSPWPGAAPAAFAAPPLCNLGKAAGTTLQLIIMRAQHPLYLTAGNFANLTLVLYLTITRKSQSIYSYLIRMY